MVRTRATPHPVLFSRLPASQTSSTGPHLSEHDVFSVEPGRLDGGNEELTAVCVWAGVGHRQEAGLGVLQLEVLILELATVDGLTPGAVASGEVST